MAGTEQAKDLFDMASSVPFTAPAPASAPLAAGVAAPVSRPSVTSAPESSDAALLVQKVADLADHFVARPTEQISVRIDLDDTSHVDVRIALHAGKVQADFQTNSPSLRTALADAWQDFTRQTPGTDQRWSEPTFTTSGTQSASASAFVSTTVSSPASSTATAPAEAATAFNTDQGSARREPAARFLEPSPGPSAPRSPSATHLASAPLHTPARRSDHSRHLDLFA